MKSIILLISFGLFFFLGCEFGPEEPEEDDTTPPGEVSGITVNSQAGALEVSWQASPDGDTASYNIYIKDETGEFALAKTTPALEAELTGLIDGMLYTVKITAVDNDNNENTGVEAVGVPMEVLSCVALNVEGDSAGVNAPYTYAAWALEFHGIQVAFRDIYKGMSHSIMFDSIPWFTFTTEDEPDTITVSIAPQVVMLPGSHKINAIMQPNDSSAPRSAKQIIHGADLSNAVYFQNSGGIDNQAWQPVPDEGLVTGCEGDGIRIYDIDNATVWGVVDPDGLLLPVGSEPVRMTDGVLSVVQGNTAWECDFNSNNITIISNGELIGSLELSAYSVINQ